MREIDNTELANVIKEATLDFQKVPVRELSPIERLAALQRRYALVHKEQVTVMPESEAELYPLVIQVSAVSEAEAVALLCGNLAEAQRTWLKTFNSCWSLAELNAETVRKGVFHVLETFDPELQADLRNALRQLAP